MLIALKKRVQTFLISFSHKDIKFSSSINQFCCCRKVNAILNTPKVLVAYPAVITNKQASIKNIVDEVLKNSLEQN